MTHSQLETEKRVLDLFLSLNLTWKFHPRKPT